MKTAIDAFGRVLIPGPIRARAALAAGTALEARYDDGLIVLEPAPARLAVVQQGRFFVARPLDALPALRAADVEREIEALRTGRDANSDVPRPRSAGTRSRRSKPKRRR